MFAERRSVESTGRTQTSSIQVISGRSSTTSR